jgi:hypothetical protein
MTVVAPNDTFDVSFLRQGVQRRPLINLGEFYQTPRPVAPLVEVVSTQ